MNQAKKRFIKISIIAFTCLLIVAGLNWKSIISEFKFWREFNSLGLNEQGYPEYKHRKSGIIMVLLPEGEFMMGSPETEEGRGKDEFLHKVRVSKFLISKHAVTQAEWERVMGSNPIDYQNKDAPVENVSWEDCFGKENSFCKKLGLSLPTEAQWEYACRAGTTTPYPFGYEPRNLTFIFVEVSRIQRLGTIKVELESSRVPNNFGLMGMNSYIQEWCIDNYVENYYSSQFAINGDKACISKSDFKVLRGGYAVLSGVSSVSLISSRSARRRKIPKEQHGIDVGFRPVYTFNGIK